jgi:hypothetical protein
VTNKVADCALRVTNRVADREEDALRVTNRVADCALRVTNRVADRENMLLCVAAMWAC